MSGKKTIHHQQMPIQPFILPKKPICSPLKNKTKLAACIAATLTNTAEQYHRSQNGTKKKLQNQPDTKGGLISESFTLPQHSEESTQVFIFELQIQKRIYNFSRKYGMYLIKSSSCTIKVTLHSTVDID